MIQQTEISFALRPRTAGLVNEEMPRCPQLRYSKSRDYLARSFLDIILDCDAARANRDTIETHAWAFGFPVYRL